MDISSKTIYGMRFMLYLAISVKDEYVKLPEIAEKQQIPEKFLENIASVIKTSGLIDVKRGSSGGYKLAVSPKDISVRSIVEILEGGIFNKINEFEHLPKEVSDINASVNEILSNIRELILDYLMEKTLDDLVSIYQKKSAQDMYYI